MGIDCSLCVVARAICNLGLSDAESEDEGEGTNELGQNVSIPNSTQVELQLCAGNYSLHVRRGERESSHGMSGFAMGDDDGSSLYKFSG